MLPQLRSALIGIMLGTLVASLNMTLVAPAMPTIVADLGGLDNYSWIALASMLASTVAVPIVGKLSDSFGRKPFYMGGIAVFLLGSMLAGFATSFEFLIFARVVQGLGMGTMMPLSQAIIGDIIPPRERGKYQGLLGAVFGVASIIGPLVGGYVTEHLGWRWLFFVNVPVGLVTLAVVGISMHVPQHKRPHVIDVPGIVTLTLALVSLLLAIEMGGAHYAWTSPQILGLVALALAAGAAFVVAERRAREPVLPLRLWKSSIFTLSNLGNVGVAMGMFGAIYFVPVYAQGVLGSSPGSAGKVLLPLMLTMVVTSIVSGQVISRTGRYKAQTLAGIAVMGAGFVMLTRLTATATSGDLMAGLLLIGLGLGACTQVFVLIVQNDTDPRDMGVATAATQLFRSIGSAAGVATMGGLMSQGLLHDIPRHLPPGALETMRATGHMVTAGSVMSSAGLAGLAPDVLAGVRAGIADALHDVFVAGVPFVALAFLATLFIHEKPLRRHAHVSMEEAGKEILVELSQSSEDAEPMLEEAKPKPVAAARRRR